MGGGAGAQDLVSERQGLRVLGLKRFFVAGAAVWDSVVFVPFLSREDWQVSPAPGILTSCTM